MAFARSSWVTALTLSLASLHSVAGAGPKPTAAQVESHTVVDGSGRPVLQRDGTRSNYSNAVPKSQTAVAAAKAGPAHAASLAAAAPAPAGQRAFASFASLGECLGCTGLPLYEHGGRTEFFASTTGLQLPSSNYPGPANDFWYALTYNAATSSFDEAYVSERVAGGIAQMLLLPAAEEEDRQLALCGIDGSIRFYSAASKTLLASETLQFPIQNVFRCAIGDFAHTGEIQYLLASNYQAAVYDRTGNLLWTLPPPAYWYEDILVGQMDGDPALEIAVSQYAAPWIPGVPALTIYDSATRAVELQLNSSVLPAAYNLALAHTGPSGAPTLIVSEGWSAVDAFDPVSGSRLWQAPTPINIESLKVTRLPGSKADQVLIGDGQWGSVHVVDATTGSEQFSIANPEWGVTQMAVGDLSNNGGREILWGGDAGNSGPQRFAIADPVSQQVLATSRDLDTYFTTPAIGHLRGDTSRQVVFASQTTDNSYDPGSIVVLDPVSGKVIAIQNVPLFQGWGSDFALRVEDVDGDGIDEIVVADTHLYDGAVDVYALTPDNKFILKSTTYQGYGSPSAYPGFTSLAIGDADVHGGKYAVVGFSEDNPVRGPTVPTVIGLDLATGLEKWRVPLPGVTTTYYGTFYGPSPSSIESLGRDATGAELFAVLRSQSTFLLPSGQFGEIDIVRVAGAASSVIASYQGIATSMDVAAVHRHRLLAGNSDGTVSALELNATSLTVTSSRSVSSASIDAVRTGRDGNIWVVTGQRAERVDSKGRVTWQSTDNGYTAPAGLVLDAGNEGMRSIWVSSIWRVDGFTIGEHERE